jgi:serine/threonine protein kinase
MEMSLQAVLERVTKGDIPDFWSDTVKSIIILGITSALAYVHSHGIVVMVLPPDILLGPDFRPRLRMSDRSGYWIDPGRRSVSCTEYDAPELATFHAEPDEKSDVFAYALIVYQIVTGRRHAPPADEYSIPLKIVPPAIPATVNSHYRELMTKGWSRSPSDRPSLWSLLVRPDLLMLESCDREAFARYRDDLALF